MIFYLLCGVLPFEQHTPLRDEVIRASRLCSSCAGVQNGMDPLPDLDALSGQRHPAMKWPDSFPAGATALSVLKCITQNGRSQRFDPEVTAGEST